MPAYYVHCQALNDTRISGKANLGGDGGVQVVSCSGLLSELF